MDARPISTTSRPWRQELRGTLALAWPLILSNLTMQLIQATDVVLMGWLGPHALAASALGINLTWPLIFVAFGLVTAAAPIMATSLGAKTRSVREVRRTFRQSLWLALAATIPLWLLLWNAEHVILALGQQPDLARDAGLFLRGYMWTVLPWLVFQTMRNFLSALERPQWILIVSAAGIVLNALLGWALIFGRLGLPRLGIFGGGLASSIVWGLLALGLFAVVLSDRRFRRFHLFGRFWRADWQRLKHLLRLGLPIGLSFGFEATVFAAAAYLMGLIDAASVAAHAIALQIAALTFMVPLGLSQAATVRVGRALGSRNPAGVSRAGWTAFAMSILFMSAMALLMWVFPRELVTLFLEPTAANQRPIELAIAFLVVAAGFQIFDGAQVVVAGMLRGLHDTRVPMLIAAFGYWVVGIGVGVWLAFDRGWQGVGIWTGLASGLALVSVLLLARWAMRGRLGLGAKPLNGPLTAH
jgi:MATE family multidrug resistance protein